MSSEFILELKNISFTYPGNRGDFTLFIEDLSFGNSSGNSTGNSTGNFVKNSAGRSPARCTAIMGENGSGKTTLGKLAAGLLRPDSGSVRYNGEDIAGWSLGHIGRQIGYLFQEPARQIFAPDPIEEITFPLELRGMPKDKAEERARVLLSEFELGNIIGNTTYTLSRGEKQRLAIAAAMACDPKFFVLDEPTTGLDKDRRRILADTLHNLMARNVGILLISHDKWFVDEIKADILTMKEGRLVDG